MSEKVLGKFLRYVRIDTASDPDSNTHPSTVKQFDLARLLVEELKELGLSNARVDEHCYVFARIPANTEKPITPIGFVAHLDTSSDVTGTNVNPQVIENYQGGDIILPVDKNVIITGAESPDLQKCIGHTLVTTDGTTLLGADDKAGIAAIMSMVQFLNEHPEVIHGEVNIAFTPDEEIGCGVEHFDLKEFGARYAYTVDGDVPPILNKETFSADSAEVVICGKNVHPGKAKDVMVNSIRAMADIISQLPSNMSPECTDGHEPYIHPHRIEGAVEKSTLKLLFRDFHTSGLEEQREVLEGIISKVKKDHPKIEVELKVTKRYRNMLDTLEKNPIVTENLEKAVRMSKLEPRWEPIRGGTDGSGLTEKGLPAPNIFMGGGNYHSPREWLSVDFLEKGVETLINLVRIWADTPVKDALLKWS